MQTATKFQKQEASEFQKRLWSGFLLQIFMTDATQSQLPSLNVFKEMAQTSSLFS